MLITGVLYLKVQYVFLKLYYGVVFQIVCVF